jgi:hypothetical protein
MNKKTLGYTIIIIFLIVITFMWSIYKNFIKPKNTNSINKSQDRNGNKILPGQNTSTESGQNIWSIQDNHLTSYNKIKQNQNFSMTLPTDIKNGLVIDANSRYVLIQDYITRRFIIVNISLKKVTFLSDSILQVAFLPNGNIIYQKKLSGGNEIISSNINGAQSHIIAKIDSDLIANFLPLTDSDILYYFSPLDVSNVDIYEINTQKNITVTKFTKLGYFAILSPDKKTLYYNFTEENDTGETLKTGVIDLATNKKNIINEATSLQTATWTSDNEPIVPFSSNSQYKIGKIDKDKITPLSDELYPDIIGIAFKTDHLLLVSTPDKNYTLNVK